MFTHSYPSDEGLIGRGLVFGVRAIVGSRYMVCKDKHGGTCPVYTHVSDT